MSKHRLGIIFAVTAWTIWGLLPIFWKSLQAISAQEILGHRIVWSFIYLWLILIVTSGLGDLRRKLKVARTRWVLLGSSVLIGFNWFLYVWAVNSGHLVEASLGYFINPLINVLLGVLILRERLRKWQWIAVALAAAGVLYLTMMYGSFPWIALTLAASFGLYGLIKKTAALNALEGLSAETTLLVLPSLAYLFWLGSVGTGSFGQVSAGFDVLLMCSGLVTAGPLLLFAASARRIPLSTLGVLQYILPTLQFLLGVFLYGEDFPMERFIGFLIIWIALALYSLESAGNHRRKNAQRKSL